MGVPPKKLGVTWENLTVKGKSNSAVLHDTVLSLFHLPEKIRSGRQPVPDKVILQDSFGCVRPGQMLLVLARPGGGATTLLRLLSNHRAGYSEVEGDVRFGTLDHKEAEEFRGEIVMNEEEVCLIRCLVKLDSSAHPFLISYCSLLDSRIRKSSIRK
jgi:ATP-binding cassette, subfamily G (WHITE), member 2, SNQ2